MSACIVGWSHTAFVRPSAQTLEAMIVAAANAAIADAARDIPLETAAIAFGRRNGSASVQATAAASTRGASRSDRITFSHTSSATS